MTNFRDGKVVAGVKEKIIDKKKPGNCTARQLEELSELDGAFAWNTGRN